MSTDIDVFLPEVGRSMCDLDGYAAAIARAFFD